MEIIVLFRVQGVLTRDIFCGLDTEEAGFRTACKEGVGVDTDKGFLHRVELSKLVFAWNAARTHAETKTRVDAIQRAHGEPVVMLAVDWLGLIDQFQAKFGMHLHDQVLPSQSYYESFEEKSLGKTQQRH